MAKQETQIEHELVPQHTKLSDKEKEDLFKKYSLHFSQLPKILVTDVALKGLGAKTMDVVKITRHSPIIGETEYYRGVVDE